MGKHPYSGDQNATQGHTAAFNSSTAKGDKAGMVTAYVAAEAARNTSRSSNEAGSASGYTYDVQKDGSKKLNKEDTTALNKATSSGSSTLNGSSDLPTAVINNASLTPLKDMNNVKSICNCFGDCGIQFSPWHFGYSKILLSYKGGRLTGTTN